MSTSQLLSAIGLSANILGTVILAKDVKEFFRIVKMTLDAHQIFIDTWMSNGHVYGFTGMDKHLERQSLKSSFWTFIGLGLNVLGFFFQLLGVLY
jgi:hypothetical protein